MASSALPDEVVDLIASCEGGWSGHASDDAFRLGLDWKDVEQVARSADWWKRESDEKHEALDGFKDAVTGRDCRGRPMYLAGKRVWYRDEVRWYVITFHEAR